MFLVIDTVVRLLLSTSMIENSGYTYYLPLSYEIASTILSIILIIVIGGSCFLVVQIIRKNKRAFVSLMVSFPGKKIPKRRIIKAKKEDIPEILSRME